MAAFTLSAAWRSEWPSDTRRAEPAGPSVRFERFPLFTAWSALPIAAPWRGLMSAAGLPMWSGLFAQVLGG